MIGGQMRISFGGLPGVDKLPTSWHDRSKLDTSVSLHCLASSACDTLTRSSMTTHYRGLRFTIRTVVAVCATRLGDTLAIRLIARPIFDAVRVAVRIAH